MRKKLTKLIAIAVLLILLVLSLVSMALAGPPAQSVICAEDYTVQAGDWISTIAEKYYGDVLAYTVIVNATNSAAEADSKYSLITNPNAIEVGQALCIPSGEEAQALLSGQIASQSSASVTPEGKMLLIVGNRTLNNIPSTLILSGGQYGDGQEFIMNAGQEIRLELEPGEYQANWSSPGGTTFGRTFRAIAGRVAIGWVVPEENYTFTELQRSEPGQEGLGQVGMSQLTMPSAMTTTTPYRVLEGKGLMVAGNRSLADIPSTLTLSGGQFGGGKEFAINPSQELLIALEPGDYRATWSTPTGSDGRPFSQGGQFTAVAGRIGIIWIVPEVSRIFFQRPGEPGQEIK